MVKLTEHQEDVLQQALQIVKTSKRLLVKGSAGVGKTTVADTLIMILSGSIKGNIYCSAPTNKAVAVLKGKVSDYPNLSFVTTHAALKLKRNIDYKTGNISFKPSFDSKYPPLKNVGLLVIDETSMLNSELLDYVEEHASKNNTLVVFIGDNKQLNPVNEEESPVFMRNYPEVELTEIIRQGSGNPIIELSRNLSLIKNKETIRTEIGGFIYTYDEDKIIETLAKVNGTDELKYLAYTNIEVDKINKLVRERVYGTPKKIEEGETLVFNAPYKDDYYTNQEILVKNVRVFEKKIEYLSNKDGIQDPLSNNPMFRYIKLKLYSVNPVFIEENEFSKGGWSDNVIVIHEDCEKDYKALVKELSLKAKIAEIGWKDYYEFIEQFADLTYNHAITVHKS